MCVNRDSVSVSSTSHPSPFAITLCVRLLRHGRDVDHTLQDPQEFDSAVLYLLQCCICKQETDISIEYVLRDILITAARHEYVKSFDISFLCMFVFSIQHDVATRALQRGI